MKSGLKIVAINALVLFVILNAIIWTLCIGNTARKALKDNGLLAFLEPRAKARFPIMLTSNGPRSILKSTGSRKKDIRALLVGSASRIRGRR